MQPDSQHDLIGTPFAVIESDPGVFTTLIWELGVRGLEVTELYSVESFATDHLNPYGLIFCYLCETETSPKPEFSAEDDLDDPDARSIWFANQLSDDACSSQAILNVLFNCWGVDLGPELSEFAVDTEKMSPVMRGLAISNSSHIREAQNSLARPADLRGAHHALATAALESAKAKAKADSSPPAKRRKTSSAWSSPSRSRRKSARASTSEKVEAYHYIGYVPAHGRVWELDGLRPCGPLDVGAIDSDRPEERAGWMDVVRPALQRRMHGADTSSAGHIQYNLLAIVDDPYLRASDELEMLKRERTALERRLAEQHPEGWEDKVDSTLHECASQAFATPLRPAATAPGRVFAADFGARKMARELAILDMPARALVPAWERCVRDALAAKVAVGEEVAKAEGAELSTAVPVSAPVAEHIKRTFDYEPFLRGFITALQDEDLLDDALEGGGGSGVTELAAASTSKSKSNPKASRKRG
ncbi:cysteine proteinase [Ganoderma leucocontextum]|nr:cysteine proteinase [Ganoderma leucocontextum]